MSRTPKQLTPEQLDVVTELEAFRCRLRVPPPAFCRQWTEYSSDVLRHMLKGSYMGNVEFVIDNYKAALSELRREFVAMLEPATRREVKPFHPSDSRVVVIDAVLAALKRKDQRRVVIAMGPTGAGKSELLYHIQDTIGGFIVDATDAWQRSATDCMSDMLAVLEPQRTWRSRSELQKALFAALRKPMIRRDTGEASPILLMLDDSNSWGAHTWNLVRDITKLTPAVVLACGLRSQIDKLARRSFAEASQVFKRSVSYDLQELTAADVLPFLQPLNLNGTAQAAAEHIAAQANLFGRYDLVERVVSAVQIERGRSMEVIRHAVAAEQSTLRLALQVEAIRRNDRSKLPATTTTALVRR